MIQTRALLCRMRVNGISPTDLSKTMEGACNLSDTLLIDCRPFMVYNKEHITSAQNIHCPSIVKRRSGGTVALSYVITSDDVRERFLSGRYRRVVVYDENTHDMTELNKESNMFFVIKSLFEGCGKTQILYLQGGYTAFAKEYPRLCINDTAPGHGEEKVSEKPKPQRLPVEILPYLYLGDAAQALNTAQLKELGITAVINVSRTCNYLHLADMFQYKMIPVDDTSTADLLMWFEDAIAFIDNVRHNGGKTFVHCQAGVSRSATICVAYTMKHFKYSLEEAYSHVKTRRRAIGPNLNFMRQLQEYETSLAKKKNPGLSLSSIPMCLPSSSVPRSPVPISPLGCSPLFQGGGNVFTFSTPPASPLAVQGRSFFGSPLVSPS